MIPRQTTRFLFLFTMFTLLAAAPAAAQTAKSYVVLPFQVNGPDKYQYLGRGVQSMLGNRLNWPGHYEPAPAAKTAPTPATTAEALRTVEALGTDVLVWGTVNIVGETAAMDIQVKGRNDVTWSTTDEVPLNDIIPSLEKAATNIRANVFQDPQAMPVRKADPSTVGAEVTKPVGPANANILYAEDGDAPTQRSDLNPQFRYEGRDAQQGRWRSQTIGRSAVSMAVGDVDGDGKSEVVLLSDEVLTVLRYQDGKLSTVGEFKYTHRATPIRVNVYDFDRDGTPEIIMSTYQDEWPEAKILSFKGDKFKVLADDIRQFIDVVRVPPNFREIPIAQPKGSTNFFDSVDIHELIFSPSSGNLTEGAEVKVPDGSNVFNIAFIPEKNDEYKVAQLSSNNNMNIFTSDGQIQSKSEDTYNTQAVALTRADKMLGMGDTGHSTMRDETSYYIPMRMLLVDLDRDHKYELMVNKDISVAAQLFDRYKRFTQGEIQTLYWDGIGMNLLWKTRRIKGTVSDIALADVNGDGDLQLVVLVNSNPNAMTYADRRAFVVAYDLNIKD